MAAAKKTIKLEDIKMDNLKAAIADIEKISDLYQKTRLRLLLVQTLDGMSTSTTSKELPTGRDAIDNSTKKTNNKKTSNKTKETVDKVKEAINNVIEATEEIAEKMTELPEEQITEIAEETNQEIEAEKETTEEVTETPVEEEPVQEEVVEEQVEETSVGTQVDEMFIDAGDGTQINIADAYNALSSLPDDENKQYIAFYLSYYDAESIAAIVSAFSSNITSDPYEFLNANNYVEFLAYFNDCLQG